MDIGIYQSHVTGGINNDIPGIKLSIHISTIEITTVDGQEIAT